MVHFLSWRWPSGSNAGTCSLESDNKMGEKKLLNPCQNGAENSGGKGNHKRSAAQATTRRDP